MENVLNLKTLEIIKFKSIENRVQLVNLSLATNVVFVPFDCELSDDLTEAIEFSLGKDVRTSKEADVIVTIDWNQETRKLQRRSTDRTPPEDIYIKYELEVAHRIGKEEYLRALRLEEINAQSIFINRNSNIKELAATMNLTTYLEKLSKSIDYTGDLETLKTQKEILSQNRRCTKIYVALQKAFARMQGILDSLDTQVRNALQTQRDHLEEAEAFERNTHVESMYLDESGSVEYDFIINKLSETLNAQPIVHDSADENFDNQLNRSHANYRMFTDEDVVFRVEHSDLVKVARENSKSAISRNEKRMRETRTVERRAAILYGPIVPFHHQRFLNQMQKKMGAKLDDFAFCMENVRPIIKRVSYEIPKRYQQLIGSTQFSSVAFERLSRKIVARDEERAIQILTDFAEMKTESIDLILQMDSALVDLENVPEASERIPDDTWSLHEKPMQEYVANILRTYVVCDAANAAKLAQRYPSKIIIVANGTVLINRRTIECGQNKVFDVVQQKIYCMANCIEFGKFVVCDLPQFYPLQTCFSLVAGDGDELMPIAVVLQEHQIGLHDSFIAWMRSKKNAWNIRDSKKKIEWTKIEFDRNLTRNIRLALKLKLNPFDVERHPFFVVEDVFRRPTSDLKTAISFMREATNRFHQKIVEIGKREDDRERYFVRFFKSMRDQLNELYRCLSMDADASLDFIEPDPYPSTVRYDYRNTLTSDLEDRISNSNRYQAAMTIMLRAHDWTKASPLIVGDLRPLLNDIDLTDFLNYIFAWMKQKIVVLSRVHDDVRKAQQIFWMYRNYRGESEVLHYNT